MKTIPIVARMTAMFVLMGAIGLFPFLMSAQSVFTIYDGASADSFEIGFDDGKGQRDWYSGDEGFLKMTYPGGLIWGAVFITFGPPFSDAEMSQRKCLDFSKYDSVYVDMRSEKDSEVVRIGLKDCKDLNNGRETKIIQMLTSNWKVYAFALPKFTTCNLNELHLPIEFVFDNKPATVYCRNVQFR